MPTTLNNPAWQQLIDENIAWLETVPRALERDHVIDCLRWCRENKRAIEGRDDAPLRTWIAELESQLEKTDAAREEASDRAFRLWERLVYLENGIRRIDATLRVPAAECVPAIGEVFGIISSLAVPKGSEEG